MLRRTLISCVLLALCAGAHAEWKKINDSAFGTMTYDTNSVRPDQGRTRVQYRIDFATSHPGPQGKRYSSATVNVAVDCKAQTVTVLDLQTNAGPHGQGEIVDRQTLPPQAPGERVAPSSSNEAIFRIACPGVAVLPKPVSATVPPAAAAQPAATSAKQPAPAPSATPPAHK